MIVIDTETTGLEPATHSILSVGAIEFENPENQFYEECSVWEGAHIDPKALEINGFKREEITSGARKPVSSLVDKFQNWADKVKDKTLAGENPSMDRDFMRMAYQKVGANWNFAYRTVDLHSVCYTCMVHLGVKPPTEKGHTGLNLDIILEYVGLPRREGTHNALTDAKLEAEAFSRLLYGKGFLTDHKSHPVPDEIKN